MKIIEQKENKKVNDMKKSIKVNCKTAIIACCLVFFITSLPLSVIIWLMFLKTISFFTINLFCFPVSFYIIGFFLKKYETNLDKFFEVGVEKDMSENMNSIEDKEVKQFCYDSSNPCPYCDTKFTHTALHCAVYFSDMERLKEAIELIKKVDGVEDYGVNDFYDSNSMCGKIFDTKDFNSRYITNIALSIGNIEIIKFLFQIIKTKGSEKLELCVGNDQFIIINPKNEESIIEAIDLYQYKKKTQTGKYILDKHQEQQDLIKNEHEKRLRGK